MVRASHGRCTSRTGSHNYTAFGTGWNFPPRTNCHVGIPAELVICHPRASPRARSFCIAALYSALAICAGVLGNTNPRIYNTRSLCPVRCGLTSQQPTKGTLLASLCPSCCCRIHKTVLGSPANSIHREPKEFGALLRASIGSNRTHSNGTSAFQIQDSQYREPVNG